MAMIVSVECPSCATAFPVDPDKVPQGGARTECTVCETPFRVDPASWGEEGGGVEPWAADATEAEVTEPVVDDSGVAMDEFAPPEEAWQPDSSDDSEATSWQGTQVDVEAATETPIGEIGELEGLESPDAEGDFSEAEPQEIETAAAGSLEALETESEFSGFGFDESGDVEATVEEVEELEAPEHELSDSLGETGELVTDQWADLVDSDTDEHEVEISSDWSADDGSTWVVETDDGPGLEIGEIELERLDTVEEHVRAAQEDPDLTEPAGGVDLNVVSTPDPSGSGDFMTREEMVLPEDALQAGGSGLEFEEHTAGEGSEQDDFAVEDLATDVTPDGQGMATEAPGPAPEMPESTTDIPQEGEFALPEPAPEAPEVVADGGAGEVASDVGSTFQFGRRDPHDKARRLARVLVSDMIAYNPERHAGALRNGSVKADFEDEIEKSWAEYVEQVGPEIAESTDYWRDALNEILAGDEALF